MTEEQAAAAFDADGEAVAKPSAEATPAGAVDLMEALKASIEQARNERLRRAAARQRT